VFRVEGEGQAYIVQTGAPKAAHWASTKRTQMTCIMHPCPTGLAGHSGRLSCTLAPFLVGKAPSGNVRG
jgi:hypothetical protein